MAEPQETLQYDAPGAPPQVLQYDQAKQRKSEEPMFGHIQTSLKNMGTGIAKNIFDVSAPGIAASHIKRFFPGALPKQIEQDTTPLKELPNEIGETMTPILAGGIMEGTPETIGRPREGAKPIETARAPEESTVGSRVMDVAKRRIGHIPGVQAVKDLDYVIRGKGEPKPPPPPTPKVPIPETDGIQWGSGGKGPIDLRGKRIPQEQPGPIAAPAAAADAADPKASPTVTPTVARPSATTSSRLDELLNDAVGGRELEPNTPLRQQLSRIGKPSAPTPKMRPISDLSQQIKDSTPASDAPKMAPLTNLSQQIKNSAVALPEGHTPVESSALRSYKYDPSRREFEALPTTGNKIYVYGDVSPEEAADFEAADSKGKAWPVIRRNPQVATIINGERIPTKPGTLNIAPGVSIPKSAAGLAPELPVESSDDLSPTLQRMLDRALETKRAGGGKLSSVSKATANEPITAEPIGTKASPREGIVEQPGSRPIAQPTVSEPIRAGTAPQSGTETRVRVPGEARAYRAAYQVRELEDVHPSHSGQTFQANPKYTLTNDRDYSNPVNQGKIVQAAGGEFDPAYHITDNPDATNGPVVVDSEGHALGGNGRTMILQRVYKSNPAGAAAYKNLLVSRAPYFGLDPEAIGNMKQPVLVREVADSEFDNYPGRKQEAITDFNKKGTAEMTPAERAIADARRVSNDTLDVIGGALEEAGPDSTLADVMRGRAGSEILERLVKDGALTPQDRAAFASESGLTQAGKDRISNLVVARFFDDPAEMDSAPPSLKTKLEKIAAPLARVEGQAGWDLSGTVREAVKLLEEMRTHGLTAVDDLLRQRGLFGESKYSPEAVSMAEQLKDTTASELVKSARKYTADAADAKRPMLLGEPVAPDQAFQEAFPRARRK